MCEKGKERHTKCRLAFKKGETEKDRAYEKGREREMIVRHTESGLAFKKGETETETESV